MRILTAVLGITAVASFGAAIGPKLSLGASEVHDAVLRDRVQAVRGVLDLHRRSPTVRLAESGWPVAVSGAWFASGDLPAHPATSAPFAVEVVDGARDQVAPSTKCFEVTDRSAHTLWYNRTNGALCARVPQTASEREMLASFNAVNGLTLPSLGDVR
jgi:hypothetical protein